MSFTITNLLCGEHQTIITNFISGGIASGITKTLFAPVERLKYIYQTADKNRTNSPLRNWISDGKFLNHHPFFRTVVHVIKRDGVPSMWQGLSVSLYRIIPYNGIRFSSHEYYKYLLGITQNLPKKHSEPMNLNILSRYFMAGSLAGVTATVATYPLDTTRVQLAVITHERRSHTTIFTHMKHRVENGGFVSLYRGMTPAIIGIIPYSGITFFIYETLNRKYSSVYMETPSLKMKGFFGSIAGGVGGFVGYPFDIVRRISQTKDVLKDSNKTTLHQQDKMSKLIRQIYKEDGIIGFYRGFFINAIKGPLAIGLTFMIFDHTSRTLSDYCN
ncbi:hypothetical protein SNEBB_003006 [Seison nebaliae]|nr:hypothetical protein SNEBB_003006 [Seison nebaliae]